MKLRAVSGATAFVLLTSLWSFAALPVSDAQAAFARLKGLAGSWEAQRADGSKTHVRYEVVSGGSAVVERFENDAMGAANAMLTVYYLDGDRLLLDHYCMAKNRPRMQASAFDKAEGKLHFEFLDAAGMPNQQAGHMHNAVFHFQDVNHFSADWQFFEGGKPKMTESANYARVQ